MKIRAFCMHLILFACLMAGLWLRYCGKSNPIVKGSEPRLTLVELIFSLCWIYSHLLLSSFPFPLISSLLVLLSLVPVVFLSFPFFQFCFCFFRFHLVFFSFYYFHIFIFYLSAFTTLLYFLLHSFSQKSTFRLNR